MPRCTVCSRSRSWVSPTASICAACLRTSRKAKGRPAEPASDANAARHRDIPVTSRRPSPPIEMPPPVGEAQQAARFEFTTRLARHEEPPAPSCSGSALPLVMALSEVLKPVISSRLKSPPAWPYDDRVLVWLSPKRIGDVALFHSRNGPSMSQLLGASDLAEEDARLVRTLVGKVERFSPGLPVALRQVATKLGIVIHTPGRRTTQA